MPSEPLEVARGPRDTRAFGGRAVLGAKPFVILWKDAKLPASPAWPHAGTHAPGLTPQAMPVPQVLGTRGCPAAPGLEGLFCDSVSLVSFGGWEV